MKTVFLFISFWALLSGCGYSALNISKTSPLYQKKVWVDFAENRSQSPTAQTVIKMIVMERLASVAGGKFANSASDADISIHAVLKSYSNNAVSYTKNDQIREYRLTVTAEFEVRKEREETPYLKTELTEYCDYQASNPDKPDLAIQKNSEEAALNKISKKLAQSLAAILDEQY